MSEEEIIRNVERIIEYKVISNYINDNDSRAIQGLLDLYNKEKEKNKNSFSIEEIEKVLENSVCSYDCLKENIQSLLYGEDCHR